MKKKKNKKKKGKKMKNKKKNKTKKVRDGIAFNAIFGCKARTFKHKTEPRGGDDKNKYMKEEY